MTHNRTVRHRALTAFTTLSFLGLLPHSSTLAQSVLTLQPDADQGKDAWIWSFENARDVNFGVRSDINGGLNNVIRAEVWEWADRADTIRALLAFNLSELPADAHIISAKLSLSFFANPQFTPQTGDNRMSIRRITSGWDEALVTWNNQPSTTEEQQVILPPSSSTSQDYPDIDVTELVRMMAGEPEKNFGLMLAMENEVVFKGLTFASSDHADATKHPKLEIRYETVSDVRATEDDKAQSSVQIRVDRSGNHLLIDNAAGGPDQLEMKIADLAGNQVLHSSRLQGPLTVNLEDLDDGLYFIQLERGPISTLHRLLRVDGRNILAETESTRAENRL